MVIPDREYMKAMTQLGREYTSYVSMEISKKKIPLTYDNWLIKTPTAQAKDGG